MAIKEEPPLTIKEGGFIKETFNKELQKIKLVEKEATQSSRVTKKILSRNWNKIIEIKI